VFLLFHVPIAGKRVEKLSAGRDGWNTLTEMPTERAYFAAAVVNGLIYVIGGRNAKKEVLNSIDSYDPVKGSWKAVCGVKPAYPRSEFGRERSRERNFSNKN